MMVDDPKRRRSFAELVADEVDDLRSTGFRVRGTGHMMAVLFDRLSAVVWICTKGRAYREPWHARGKLVNLAAIAQVAAEDLGFLPMPEAGK